MTPARLGQSSNVPEMGLYPHDLNGDLALCLRIDHTHLPELGCWEPRPTHERLAEIGVTIVKEETCD